MLVLWPPIIDLNPISNPSSTPPRSSPATPPSPVFEATIPPRLGSSGSEAVATPFAEDSAVVEGEEPIDSRTEAQDNVGHNTIEDMAANLPAKLNTPDLRPFIVRASQLEKARPVIAYWCKLPCFCMRESVAKIHR